MVEIKTYDNKSRKGTYYYATYKDESGKTRTSQIKTNKMTASQFEDYVNKVKFIKTTKEKRAFTRSYVSPQELKSRIQKERIPAEEKVKTEKDYNLERQISKNKLFVDREAKKLPSEYEGQEARIILNVGRSGSLGSMSEEQFRNKLYSYMNIDGEPKGVKAVFIEDIINKWGVEFKQ